MQKEEEYTLQSKTELCGSLIIVITALPALLLYELFFCDQLILVHLPAAILHELN
jgi:hypothetical protein